MLPVVLRSAAPSCCACIGPPASTLSRPKPAGRKNKIKKKRKLWLLNVCGPSWTCQCTRWALTGFQIDNLTIFHKMYRRPLLFSHDRRRCLVPAAWCVAHLRAQSDADQSPWPVSREFISWKVTLVICSSAHLSRKHQAARRLQSSFFRCLHIFSWLPSFLITIQYINIIRILV